MTQDFFTAGDGLVRLAVRLTPRASRSGIVGPIEDGSGKTALAIRIAAPPVEGAANEALIAYLGKALGLPKSAVSIDSGAKSRTKILLLKGDPHAIGDRLRTLAPDPSSPRT